MLGPIARMSSWQGLTRAKSSQIIAETTEDCLITAKSTRRLSRSMSSAQEIDGLRRPSRP